MKKLMIVLVLAATAIAQLASANTFTDRRALLDKAKASGNKVIEIGFNPGNNGKKEELFFWSNKYWPMANNLIAQTGDNISFIPENDSTVLLNLVRAQRYKWLYVPPNIAVIAQEHGYTPLAYMNRDIESVFVVPTESTLTKTSDLKGKKIATLASSNDLRLAKYYLHTENWDANFIEIGANDYSEVEFQLTQKKVDAIAVSREAAMDIITRSKDAYKILATSGGVPRTILLSHVSVNNDEINRIASAIIKVPASAMSAMGLTFAENEIGFSPFTKDHLRYMRASLGYIESDYGRAIFDPKLDKYVESAQAFTEGVVKPVLKTPNP